MVDRSSLETLAADRGITICFVELDGAEGLWLPDERTIMIDARLGDRRASEVLEHELTHVDIEDGHAALDAAMRRRPRRARFAAASAAAASLLVLVAVRMQLAEDPVSNTRQDPPTVAGRTTAPPQGGHQRPAVTHPAPPTTVVTQVFDGEVITTTLTVTPSTVTRSPTSAMRASSHVTPIGPTQPAGTMTDPTTTPPPAPPTTTTAQPPPTTSDTATPTTQPPPTIGDGTSADATTAAMPPSR